MIIEEHGGYLRLSDEGLCTFRPFVFPLVDKTKLRIVGPVLPLFKLLFCAAERKTKVRTSLPFFRTTVNIKHIYQ